MSLAQTSPAPAAGTTLRGSLLRWIAGGSALAALLAVVAIAAWPASATDKARSDGEQLGAAVSDLYNAASQAEVDAALADMNAAVADARTHAGDEVADQVADQQDALARAADGFAGSVTSEDEWDAELYQAELDYALDDLTDQASEFRSEGPQVRQAFWEGVEDGLSTA